MLLLICVVPLTILLAYLLIMTNKISSEYDGIVRRITKANAYNINFKEDMDYVKKHKLDILSRYSNIVSEHTGD